MVKERFGWQSFLSCYHSIILSFLHMKTIGLIGGMSWESSAEYYRILNEETKNRLGGAHSCPCILYSVDFQPIEELQHLGKWQELKNILNTTGDKLVQAGAGILLLCTNTMHVVADELEQLPITFIHIADATGEAVQRQKLKKIGLLGTRFTMEMDFFKKRLKDKFGIETIVPEEKERNEVHRIIYEELVYGNINSNSKKYYMNAIEQLAATGAEGIILGCTEIPLLIKQEDSELQIFDTTYIHAMAALSMAMH